MKKDDANTADNVENSSKQQKPQQQQKVRSKPAKIRKVKKEDDGVRLPFLVEFTYSISTILLLFLGLSMAVVSFITGANLLNLVLRTSVAVLVMGSLLMLISSQISSGVLTASLAEQKEAREVKSEETESAEKIENQSAVEVE